MKKLRKIPVVLMAIFIMLGCRTVYGEEMWEQDGAQDYSYEESAPEYSPVVVMSAREMPQADQSSPQEEEIYAEEAWADTGWTPEQDIAEDTSIWVEEYNAAESPAPAVEEYNADQSPVPAAEEYNADQGPVLEEAPKEHVTEGIVVHGPKETATAQNLQQLMFLPVEIKSDAAQVLSAGSFNKITLEIKNSISWDMNNIELVLASGDSRYIITSFTEEYEAQNTDFSNLMNEESRKYREKVLRISNIPAGAAVRAQILVYAENEIVLTEEGLEGQAFCKFRSGDGLYAGGGTWKLKQEAAGQQDTYQEQQDLTEEDFSDQTAEYTEQPQEVYEEYGREIMPQEEYEAQIQDALTQDEPEEQVQHATFKVFGSSQEPEDQKMTKKEPEEAAPEYLELGAAEGEEQMEMLVNDEEQLITFHAIEDENEEVQGTEEDEEYYDYYDFGYYDDWYSFDSVAAEQINTATPYLLVKSYSHKKTVKTGENFGIDVTFLNTSGKLGMENIVIKVETSDALSLENGTNVLFINDLGAGQSSTQSLHMLAASECKNPSQSISFTITFEYVENKERKQGTASESITIPVSQQDRLELRDPVYDEMEAGKEGVISVSYVNKGYTSLYNMEAQLSMENADAVQTVVYAGNVESGKSGTLDFLVTPLSDGEYKGEITLKYEDSSQKETAVVIPLEFTSTAAFIAEDFVWEEEMEISQPQEQGGIPQPLMMGASGGIIIAGIIIATAIVRKKKAKRRTEEAVDDWFDSAE